MVLPLILFAALATAPKPELRIHLFTHVDPSGLVDADQQRRQDSIEDLRGVLDKGLKAFTPVLVDSPAEAHVLIEVLSSAQEDTGDRIIVPAPIGFSRQKVSRKATIRANVMVGAYTTEIVSPPIVNSWKLAAGHWQREFRKWANANAARLLVLTSSH